ncbi:site-specific DNA-methyltransferase [Pseudomonas sp. zjy_13]|uniref:site-specific DNA-methyltransferase n=1 Tax=Pseudomonas sp. zjy_13 TaxID=3367263 RepID=UPI00370B4BCF
MTDKPKLELTWIGKEHRPRLEPRILIEDKALSYQAHRSVPAQGDLLTDTSNQVSYDDNLLIQGDNLLALKALEAKYAGKVKCVFIDPPYNTGSAFTHYEDGVEHSMWLTLIRDRLEIIRNLLADDGSIWITIDDNEAHYLKVLCDEIFGRRNFVANVVWQKAYTPNQTARHISNTHDHVLVYAKDTLMLQVGKLGRTDDQVAKFSNHDNDPRGPWKPENLSAGKFYSAGQFEITGPSGKTFLPPKGRYWRCNEPQYQAWLADGRITFGKGGDGRPMLKKFLAELKGGITPSTWWPHEEVGSNKEASLNLKQLFGEQEVFSTPKPEKLLSRIIELTTTTGDLVLDSFAGSGTTGAVAHKMGRRWIMVEIGEHCHTHIVPRLKKVIDGEDQGGISKAMDWQGGGGFRYLRLAPSLLKKDQWGNWVINPDYNAEMLAEAMCKHMGFQYAPSQTHFWEHGRSSESDFIYVTTGSLSHDQLRRIGEEVGKERTLLICCKAFMADVDAFPNLTLKKIPQAILGKCEWDEDDYSFTINLSAEPTDQALEDK